MPYCPVCGQCYRDGFDVCADCGVRLTAGEPPDGFAPMTPLSELVPVVGVWGWMQTSIICSLLESCGIRVRVFGCSSPAELMTGATGIRALLVDSRDAQATREILAAGPGSFLPCDSDSQDGNGDEPLYSVD